ncbi:MAG: hypothetical protein OSB44_06990 [Verrucomicrobiales bacterium]|nr:hypothetical protein [Verrucomicrobiales bacterium]
MSPEPTDHKQGLALAVLVSLPLLLGGCGEKPVAEDKPIDELKRKLEKVKLEQQLIKAQKKLDELKIKDKGDEAVATLGESEEEVEEVEPESVKSVSYEKGGKSGW